MRVIFNDQNECGITYYSRKLVSAFEKIKSSSGTLIQHDPGLYPDTREFFKFYNGIPGDKMVTYHSVRPGTFRTNGINFVDKPLFHTKSSLDLHGKGHLVPHGCDVIKRTRKEDKGTVLLFGFNLPYKNFAFLEKIKKHRVVTMFSKPRGKVMPENELNELIQGASLVVFPYLHDFYGASGALRTAMGNGAMVLGSWSPLFDDTPVTRCREDEMPGMIDRILGDDGFRAEKISECLDFCEKNSWEIAAKRHVEILNTSVTT